MKRDNAKRTAAPLIKGAAAGDVDDLAEATGEEVSSKPTPFDVRTVKALVGLMTQHDLSEIDLRDGHQRVRLRRGTQPTVVAAAVPAPAASPSAPTAAPTPVAPAAPTKKLLDIKSQTVGTFYSAPNPGAEPFVKVGSKVSSSSVVGLIEAMKLFNEINAECAGVVVEILVENQQPVEFGQVLMRVDPAA